MSELLEWTRAHSGEMLSLLRDLVLIETPSRDPDGVETLARRLLPEFQSLGLSPELVPVTGAGPLIRAGDPGGIFLLGHLDTVWPKGTLTARPPRQEGDRFFAPGAYDMKGGLVIALYALKALASFGKLPRSLVVFTPLEEIGGGSYLPMMQELMRKATAVLDFEPAWPGGAVKTARKGALSLKLRAFGRAAHAGADFSRGESAILQLAQAILETSALTDIAAGITVNVGVIRGGTQPNVVPDWAEADVDTRFTKATDEDRLDASFRALRPSREGTRLEWEVVSRYPPLERTLAVAALFEKARQAAATLGLTLEETSTGGASEAAFAAALGVPTLDGLGADGDGAHARDEHILVSSLAERAALSATLMSMLGPEGKT